MDQCNHPQQAVIHPKRKEIKRQKEEEAETEEESVKLTEDHKYIVLRHEEQVHKLLNNKDLFCCCFVVALKVRPMKACTQNQSIMHDIYPCQNKKASYKLY